MSYLNLNKLTREECSHVELTRIHILNFYGDAGRTSLYLYDANPYTKSCKRQNVFSLKGFDQMKLLRSV